MEHTDKEIELLEMLMSAWVRGWYSGRNGDLNDDKKRIDCPDVLLINRHAPVRLCCNSHDGLVEACEAMKKAWIQPAARSMHQLRTDMDNAYKQADEALSALTTPE